MNNVYLVVERNIDDVWRQESRAIAAYKTYDAAYQDCLEQLNREASTPQRLRWFGNCPVCTYEVLPLPLSE